uniref:Integrin, alpha M (complement component 3 receptor 3 subunit) n=1 Tax=Cyprinus carpio carpio TaxID=630221 RepID=A0A8C1C9P7_CYPCA
MMDQNFCIILCLFCVSQSVMAFNIEPSTWKTFTPSQNVAFGYKIIQNDESSLIVSDPLIQINQDKRGRIYNCLVTQGTCSSQDIDVPSEAVNMSLGLSLVKDAQSSKVAICGPTIPKKCVTVTTYNGMCFISENNVYRRIQRIPKSLRDCTDQIDIAFLLDGSGSVREYNFRTMKDFVRSVIKRFTERDAQFAIAQYSKDCIIHYSFNELKIQGAWESNVTGILYQSGPNTYTATAIKKLVKDLFIPAGGLRLSAKKVLIVITDGASHDRILLDEAAKQAEDNKIVRFAIGVGNAFNDPSAKGELNTIASDPDNDHVFKVTDFNALNNILQKLEESIIAIEGTQTSGDSSRMEFAQDGFSTAFTSYGSVLMSAVGAFQWKGGYQEYPTGSFQTGNEHESYLGYSMAVAKVPWDSYAILGAPRYKHQGRVIVSQLRTYKTIRDQELYSPRPQTGSYFGAEVCVVDLNNDSKTDLLLVSAPTYMEPDREGKVYVYTITNQFVISDVVLVGMAGQRGRFGSSLASPADLNGDGFRDVLIGAPLEEDGQGSIYIFNGGEDQINPTYSQRIAGSSVRPGLRFFGISLSQSSLDQTRDTLPDIAVGSMGAVLLLRSRPIMHLETRVTYNPSKIPTGETDQSLKNTMKVCFTMRPYRHSIRGLTANINYTITLDAKRQKYRAYFSPKNHFHNNDMKIRFYDETCKSHPFLIDAFSEDALIPLSNQLTFTFEGLPSANLKNIRPILLPGIKTTTDHNLDFEINCGHDEICVDDLRMDFSFSGSTNIEVGIMQEIDVAVFVENRGENSYNTFFTLNYPFGLSYRRITSKQGRVECVSLDSEQKGTFGETTCSISKPILKGNAQAVFHITYSIDKESTFDQKVRFTARINSGNDQHSQTSELSKEKSIGVKYAMYIALIRHEDSTLHINFTAQKNDTGKPVKQILKVENDFRELSFKVFIRVPVMLGEKSIWTNKNIQIPGCVKQRDKRPVVTDFVEVIKKDRVVNCSVAVCAEFSCNVTLIKNERMLYNITGNVSSGWIEQTGLGAGVFQLVSSASLDYNQSKYVFFSSDSQQTVPSVQINTQVEVYEEVNLTKEIAGGIIGGLLLLALITAALYKSGFFKSHYKQLLENAEESPEEGPTTKYFN